MMKKLFLPILLIGCLLLSACSSNAAPAPSEASAPMAMPTPTAPAASYDFEVAGEPQAVVAEATAGGYGSVADLPMVTESRKVAYSAEYILETDDYNGTMRRLEQKIGLSGSYIQQSDSRAATEYSPAYASMTIRVPASAYGDFKSFLGSLATLSSSREHGEDVTAQYFDTEARLKVLQAQEERVRSFIAASKDLDEIFKIERELTRITTEIEQLTTVKNRLDNLVSYATIYVEVHELAADKIIEPLKTPFGERVNEALQGSLKGLVAAVQAVLLFLIWIWPLLLLAAVAIPLWRRFGKRRERQAQKPEQKE